jgi:hypothetical protein
VSTALLLAAALALGQAETPAPASPASATQPAAAPTPVPAVPPATVSTTAQDPLEVEPTVRPFEMPAIEPAAPVAYADASNPKIPVKVEDYHRSYEGPQDEVEAYYDAGVRQAYEAEQALHGPLDGMWTLSAVDGPPLLLLAISDPGGAAGPQGETQAGALGGAWRDLSRANDPNASGLIDSVARDGRSVVMRIALHEGAPAATLRLTQGAEGRWRGLLVDGAGPGRAVVLERKGL